MQLASSQSSGYQSNSQQLITQKDCTVGIANLERNTKSAIARNRIKLVIVLNLIPLAGIIYSQISPRWARIFTNDNAEYWANFTLVAEYINGKWQMEDEIKGFSIDECRRAAGLCKSVTPYILPGYMSLSGLIFVFLLHSISMLQMFCLAFRWGSRYRERIAPQMVQLFVLIGLLAVFGYWCFDSMFFPEVLKSGHLLSSLGSSMMIYGSAVVFYLLLTTYFRCIYKSTQDISLVNQLLYAENQLTNDLLDDSKVTTRFSAPDNRRSLAQSPNRETL